MRAGYRSLDELPRVIAGDQNPELVNPILRRRQPPR
jgi:hypothetical protein